MYHFIHHQVLYKLLHGLLKRKACEQLRLFSVTLLLS